MRHGKWFHLLALAPSAVMLTVCGQSGEAKEEATFAVAGDTAKGTGNTQGTETAQGTGGTEYKMELNAAVTINPPALNVHGVNSNIVRGISTHIYEPLFAMGANCKPADVLADSYTVSEDGKVYTIKLRRDVKFHNGQEMTANDVATSASRRLELSGKAETLPGGTVFGKADDYTITITPPEAYADAMTVVAASVQFPVVYPKSIIDSAGTEGITECIGTGPYRLDEWKQGQYIHLVKCENYVRPARVSSDFTGEKLATTPDVYFRVVTDDSTRVAGVQTGQYDIAEEMPQERYQELFDGSSLRFYIKTAGTINLFFNTTKGIMTNEQMRQAIMACPNCDDIMLVSYGDPSLYVLNPGWCNPDDAIWGNDAGSEYYNQDNIEKTKELLTEADHSNEGIVLITTPGYGEVYNATLVVQAELQNAGINATVESYDFTAFMGHRANPDQLSLYVTSNHYNLNPVQLSVLTKDWAELDRPGVDQGIFAIRMAASAGESPGKWDDLQELLYEYGAANVLGYYSGLMATGTGVEGFNFFGFLLYWNVEVPV